MTQANLPHDLMTDRELAARWHKSIRTLQRWRSEGYGPRYLSIGGTIRYRFTDVLEFEERQSRGGGIRT
jgi:hypothetical protein